MLLGAKPSLKSLNLVSRGIGNSGAYALAAALKRNCTLEDLDLYNNEIGDEGITALAGALLSNRSIKSIDVGGTQNDGLTAETETAILKAIERNTSLRYFGVKGMSPMTSGKVGYLLLLNRGGRRILSSRSHVPLSYWPRILAKSSSKADVLFFFLRQKNDTLIPRPPAARKRKRGDD
jgi:hypothetical protein